MKSKNKNVVYIGPTVRGYAEHGTVYKDRAEAEAGLSRFLAKHPAAAEFIVPVCELPKARLEIKTPGNALYEMRKRFLGEIREV